MPGPNEKEARHAWAQSLGIKPCLQKYLYIFIFILSLFLSTCTHTTRHGNLARIRPDHPAPIRPETDQIRKFWISIGSLHATRDPTRITDRIPDTRDSSSSLKKKKSDCQIWACRSPLAQIRIFSSKKKKKKEWVLFGLTQPIKVGSGHAPT